jgi:hypothetical protein
MSRDKDQVGDNESFTSGIVFQVGLVDIKDRTRALRTGIIRDMCTILQTLRVLTVPTRRRDLLEAVLIATKRRQKFERHFIRFVSTNQYCFWYEQKEVDVLDFLMGCESYLRKRRISVSGRQIFHWIMAPPSRYFQGHSP